MDTPTDTFILKNIGELVTLAPLAQEKRVTQIKQEDLGCIQEAWLACKDGQIHDFGQNKIPETYDHWQQYDAMNSLVMPGLVDCHTHPLFAGNRSNEFAKRLDGATYQDIAAAGGGIQATVNSTKGASDSQLTRRLEHHLDRFLQWGVTTVECKSGYGLSIEEELRHLRIIKKLSRPSQKLVLTCLALHAIPTEIPDEPTYIQSIMGILETLHHENLAQFVDMFIEQGYFSPQGCEPFVKKAQELGFGIRVHADEFTDSQGAAAAAKWKAASADHLQQASFSGLQDMAANGVTAVILPGTSLYTNIPFTNGARITEAGCSIAIASDFNPGSCHIDNLPMLASLAGVHCGLSPSQIIAGITFVPAYSLGLETKKGALAKGHHADFIISPFKCLEDFLADFGCTKPSSVWYKGKKHK